MADEAQVREILAPALEPTFFDFNLPFGLSRWFLFVVGLLLSALGILFGISPYNPLALAVVIYFFGYMLAASFPSAIVIVVRNLRNLSPGGSDVHYATGPNQEKTQPSIGTETEGWILNPPQIAEWNLASPHSPDAGGMLAEHPRKLGTPVPATFTMYSMLRLFQSFAAGVFVYLAVEKYDEVDPARAGVAIALLILLVQFFRRRKTMRISDLATSSMQGLPMGGVEVFGQLRPRLANGWVPPIAVDGDRNKMVYGQLNWYWEYGHKFTWDEYVETKDDEGNVSGEWKSRSDYRRIRNDDGGALALVHDGTGGVAVESDLLDVGTRPSTGSWSDEDRSLWNTRSRPSGKVRDLRASHEWKSNGWSIGDPFFSHCYARPKTNAEIEQQPVDKTIAPSLIMLTKEGEEPGHKVMVHRGSEILALSNSESAPSAYLPSLLLAILSGIAWLSTL